MPREQEYDAFVLKRTDFGETDQIITVFTEQEGKLRAMVKAAKLPTSKLQPALQPLFKVKIRMAGNGSLPKIIGAQVTQSFPGFYADTNKLECWYLASELLIKAMADGSPNEPLFHLLAEYLQFVSDHDLTKEQVSTSLIQFQIKALRELGMGIKSASPDGPLWFSSHSGGFMTTDKPVDAVPVQAGEYAHFEALLLNGFGKSLEVTLSQPLARLVNQFVTYQLERELKTAQYISRS
jgi:DNA repair protein RecO